MENPYLVALTLFKKPFRTNSQIANRNGLAKCILSLRSSAFSLVDILAPLNRTSTKTALLMINSFANEGLTAELSEVGSYVDANFPRLVEHSNAMQRSTRVQGYLEAESESGQD